MQRWFVAHTSRDRSSCLYHRHRSPEPSEFFDRNQSRRRISFADPISLSTIIHQESVSGRLPHFNRSRSLPNSKGTSHLSGLRNFHDVKDALRKPSSEPAEFAQTDQQEDAHQISKDLRRVVRLVDRIILKHYELEQEHQKLRYCELYLQQSTDEFTAAVDLLIDGGDLGASRNSLFELRSRMKSDGNAFRAQMLRLQMMRTTVSTLESRLKQKGRHLARVLKEEDSINAQLFASTADSDATSLRSSAESSTPSLLAAYYDRKGMVGVYRERLEELEYNYLESLDASELRLDGKEDTEVSDAEYSTSYTAQRQTIMDALDTAKRETEELVAKCRNARIEIPHVQPEMAACAASTAPDSLRLLDLPPSNLEANLHETSNPSDLNSRSPRTSNSVAHWLDVLTTAAPDSCEAPRGESSPTLPGPAESQYARQGERILFDETSLGSKPERSGSSNERKIRSVGDDETDLGVGEHTHSWNRLQHIFRHLFSRNQTV